MWENIKQQMLFIILLSYVLSVLLGNPALWFFLLLDTIAREAHFELLNHHVSCSICIITHFL